MQCAWLKFLMKERPYNSLNFRKDNLVRKKGKCSLKDFILVFTVVDICSELFVNIKYKSIS